MNDLTPLIHEVLPEVRALRRDLHAHPELGYEEVRTSARVAETLERLPGFDVRRGLAVTGLVATLDAHKPGPCIALRADMDALPMHEETGLEYSSRHPGRMHACGHDGHTAALVGAAMVLARIRDQLSGPVKLLFQPAEEGGGGGQRMVADGALEDPRVDAVFGAHNWPSSEHRFGDVALRSGPFMGGSLDFHIVIHGRGGHAAMPHRAIDPVLIGAHVVTALQSLVSRETDPTETLVVTVSRFNAGSAINVIPETARMDGTVRSLSPRALETAPARLRALAEGIAAAHGARAEVVLVPGYPVTSNDARAAAFACETAAAVFGAERVISDVPPVLGSEDFSFYQLARPGCFYFLGSRPEHLPSVPFCHHPKFDYNDDLLPLAIRMHCELARRFAPNWNA
jgi:amidohydrolase